MSMGSWLMASSVLLLRGRESSGRVLCFAMSHGRALFPCVWRGSRQFTPVLSRVFSVTALCVSALAFAAEPPSPPLAVNTRAVPDKVKLGEPFAVEVVLTHTKDQRYDLKPLADDNAFDVG